MSDQQDMAITWNPTQFLDALNAVVDKLSTLSNKSKEIGDTSTKAEKKGENMFMSLAGKALIAGAAFLSIRKALSFLPEVGQAFSIAGDIITKQLFWPLRQLILPLLQKMLDWVRDHRAMFLRWGVAIANVFRVVWGLVQSFYEMVKRLGAQIAAGIKSIFGSTSMSITQMFNMVLFKIATVATFLMIILEPIAKFMIDMYLTIIRLAKSFVEGLIEGLSAVMVPLQTLFQSFKELFDMFGDGGDVVKVLSSYFKTFGTLLGSIVTVAINLVAQALDGVLTGIKTLVATFKLVKGIVTGDKDAGKKYEKEMTQIVTKFGERSVKRAESVGQSVVKGASAVADTARVGLQAVGVGPSKQDNSTNVQITNLKVESKDPKAASKEISQNLAQELKKGGVSRGSQAPGGKP